MSKPKQLHSGIAVKAMALVDKQKAVKMIKHNFSVDNDDAEVWVVRALIAIDSAGKSGNAEAAWKAADRDFALGCLRFVRDFAHLTDNQRKHRQKPLSVKQYWGLRSMLSKYAAVLVDIIAAKATASPTTITPSPSAATEVVPSAPVDHPDQ